MPKQNVFEKETPRQVGPQCSSDLNETLTKAVLLIQINHLDTIHMLGRVHLHRIISLTVVKIPAVTQHIRQCTFFV